MSKPWILMLNDMRSPKIEYSELAIVAGSREEIEAILKRESVEPYRDDRWGKTFRKGGPLEWFNRPSETFGQAPREVAHPREVAADYMAKLSAAPVFEWHQ